MVASALPIEDLEGLRRYVQETLCEQNHLEIGAFEMSERILVRGQRPSGLFFCLHGPRSVKLTAIWETDRNTILFYNSQGERIHKPSLLRAPKFAPAEVA